MTKTVNQSGSKLKDIINGADKYFTDSDIPAIEIECEYLSKNQAEAFRAVLAYKRRRDEIARSGTLTEHVYNFMGGWEYSDKFYEYQHLSVDVLTALCDTKFKEAALKTMGEYTLDGLVELMKSLFNFTKDLEQKGIQQLLLLQDIKERDLSDESLQEITDEYTEKLHNSLTGKFTRY